MMEIKPENDKRCLLPSDAAGYRRTLVNIFGLCGRIYTPPSYPQPTAINEALAKDALINCMRDAAIIVWKYDLWRAALSGSEVFVGHRISETTPIAPLQLWLVDRDLKINMPDLFPDWEKYVQVAFLVSMAPRLQTVTLSTFMAPDQNHWDELLINSGGSIPIYAWTMPLAWNEPARDKEIASFVAILEFLKLKVVDVRPHMESRQVRRQLARHGKKPEDVRVVSLRRTAHGTLHEGPGEHRDVEWSCQWIVSGHWREQWYPSAGQHRPVFVAPYIKGPEDKPLKSPGEKIYAVVR